jgi:hypothetical protein
MKSIKQLAVLSMGALLLAGCAKEKAYDEEYKAEIESMADFPCGKTLDQAPKMLYVPMTLGTPRKVREANPFYQGDEKVVKCLFTKDGIEIIELEKDERFADNTLNHSPVLSIPVEYKQFGCAEDDYGDCTNKEEEKKELEWFQKTQVEADYADLKVKEVNMLDLTNIEGSDCVKSEGVKVVSTEKSPDGVLNIQLEKSYKLSKKWECIRNNYFEDNFKDNSFKVRFFYSMVSLDKLSTPGYEKVEYPITNHDVFGFFKSKNTRLNDDFDSQRKEETYLINRWDPNKEVLTYYLSPSYSLEKNKPILEATMKSLEVMNRNLETAGVNFRLQFIEQPDAKTAKSPGDLRYNSIVLIDDPLANGLLGYAPTVKNPETGEIIQGHINMYGGVLTSGTRWVYEGAIDVMEEELASQKQDRFDESITLDIQALKDLKIDNFPAVRFEQALGVAATDTSSLVQNNYVMKKEYRVSQDIEVPAIENLSSDKFVRFHKEQLIRSKQEVDFRARFNQLMSRQFEGMNEIEKRIAMEEADEYGYKLDTKHHVEFFPIAATTKAVFPELKEIEGILDSRGILKRWVQLTKAQKEKVKTIILVRRYVATFVHEMGHSLGLRHNFKGSFDADNFYTDKEAQDLGMDQAPAYSSVMDYSFSEFNQLGAFGKYDVAALKYGYTGDLTLENGQPMKVPEGTTNLFKFRTEFNENIQKHFIKNAKEQFEEHLELFKKPLKDIKFYEAHKLIEVISKNPNLPASIQTTIGNLLGILKWRINEFEYCTDENASLSSSCNRFDEGSTLAEVAKHRVERYEQWYRYRNFRDGRLDFSANDMDSYIVSRYRGFAQTRDLLEDAERFLEAFGPGVLIDGCSQEETMVYWFCDMVNDHKAAIDTIGDHFINILKTPDLTCAIAHKDSPKKIIKLEKMYDIYNSIKYDIKKHLVTSCFDDEVKAHFAEDDLIVVGENGKFLNGFKDTNPDYKYITDRAVRGFWPDKVMAFRYLLDRTGRSSTTDRSHFALVDHPIIKQKLDNVLEHMVLGKPLDNPLPFKKENGELFVIPYTLVGEKIQNLESHHRGLKRFLGMPMNGEADLTKIILAQVKNLNTSFGTKAREKASIANNYVTVRRDDGFLADNMRLGGALFRTQGDKFFVATERNHLAYFMMDVQDKKPKLDKMGKAVIAKIYKQRTNPEAPEGVTAAEALFFGIDVGYQVAINNSLKTGQLYPEAVFISVFGEEIGKALFVFYQAASKDSEVAKKMQELTDLKDKLMKEPMADATEDEKALFGESIDILKDYLDGAMSAETFDFYNDQLSILPKHISFE